MHGVMKPLKPSLSELHCRIIHPRLVERGVVERSQNEQKTGVRKSSIDRRVGVAYTCSNNISRLSLRQQKYNRKKNPLIIEGKDASTNEYK